MMSPILNRWWYRWRMNPTRQSAIESAGIILVLLLSLPLAVDLGYHLLYRPLVYTNSEIARQDHSEIEEARERWKHGRWPAPWQIIKTAYLIGMLAVSAVVGAILTAGQLKYRLRRKIATPLCPNCGYDVRTSQHRCPECGGPIGRGPMAI